MFWVALFVASVIVLCCRFVFCFFCHRESADIKLPFTTFIRDFQSVPNVFYCDYMLIRCTVDIRPDIRPIEQFDSSGNMDVDFDADDIEELEDLKDCGGIVDISFSFVDYIRYCLWLHKIKRRGAINDRRSAMVKYMSGISAAQSLKGEQK